MGRIIQNILDRKARSRSPALIEEETLAAAAEELSREAQAAAAIELRNANLNL